MQRIDFFYDIGSPYSYVAATQMGRLTSRAEVHWRPFLIGGVFKATGNQPPAMLPARAPYLRKDLERLAAFYRVPFNMPSRFPLNTLLAMRCLHAVDPDVLEVTSMALFEAYWVEDRDVSDGEVLASLLGKEVVDRAGTDAVKVSLKDATDEAVMRGAFGAPSFFLEEELYFGEDRMFLLEHALKGV